MVTLKDHVSGTVEFQYYRAGNLIYKTSTGLEFPVPVSDTNEATFPRSEKGIFFMRWIRKHMGMNIPPKVQEPLRLRTASEIEQERLQEKFGQSKFTN